MFKKSLESRQEELRNKISVAQDILPEVAIGKNLVKLIVETCINMGVRTHRAEITIVRTAKTIAALDGRKEVSKDDIKDAMELALPHRMRRKPFEEPKLDRDQLDEELNNAEEDNEADKDKENSDFEKDSKKKMK